MAALVFWYTVNSFYSESSSRSEDSQGLCLNSEALVFRNTFKWMLSSLKSYFFLGMLLFKESPKKHAPSFSLP